jgi:PncC family amidohydrolase
VPGSSAWFTGGIIAYDNAVKTRGLGVSPALIKKHGAVSAECAAAMAHGARKAAGAGIGVAITGIAGPGGGTTAKPVGLVHVAVSGPGREFRARRLDIHGPRESVRSRAVTAAMSLLKEVLDASVGVS